MIYAIAFGAALLLSNVLGRYTWTDEDAAPDTSEKHGFGPPISLPAALRGFYGFLVPWLLTLGALGFWISRLIVGGPATLGDLVATFLALFSYPFLEWGFHLLEHKAPLRLFGREITMVAARTHRAHHKNPWNPRFGITTAHNLPMFFVALPAVLLWLLPLGPALTATACLVSGYFWYEWIHYLTHTSYHPRTSFYAKLRTNHRRHHFRNEQLWLGVTALIADRVLGTLPDEDARVPQVSSLAKPGERGLFGPGERAAGSEHGEQA